MKNKILVSIIGIFFTLLFSGLNIPANRLLSSESISVIAVSDERGNSDSGTCPFLQGKYETSCPYLIDNIEESNASCPYLSGKENCPYTGKEIQKSTCPYLNQDLKEDEIKDKIYNTIKNTST